jgi:hypothetical protein
MPEIRRIREAEADAAVELWDRMCRAAPDGGPLTDDGRRRIGRMLAIAAWHRNTFCLVAVDEQDRVTGFGLGRLDDGDGLLPAVVGEVQEVYAPDDRERLADAVIARLRELGASTLRVTVAADDPADQRFWARQGFTDDLVVMSRYG